MCLILVITIIISFSFNKVGNTIEFANILSVSLSWHRLLPVYLLICCKRPSCSYREPFHLSGTIFSWTVRTAPIFLVFLNSSKNRQGWWAHYLVSSWGHTPATAHSRTPAQGCYSPELCGIQGSPEGCLASLAKQQGACHELCSQGSLAVLKNVACLSTW